MKKIIITFPDGNSREYDNSVTGYEIAKSISQRLEREALAIVLNGNPYDLHREILDDSKVEILTFDNDAGKEIFWHSTAHILAQAVTELFPNTKLTIGPAIEQGFYYDFDSTPFSESDLEKIELRMNEIAKRNISVNRRELSKEEAKELFKDNPYKLELIEEFDQLSIYTQGDFIDLCKGPHISNTGIVKAIKLLKTSGAYWKGNSENKQLQRIYGISFPKKSALDEYLKMVEEAEKRNHRKIGSEMELFDHFEMIGKGLPVWLPKGEIIKNEIEKFAIEMEDEAGFERVSTPMLSKKELFEKSGHIPYYEEDMYPAMKMDDGTYYLKAMNCPMHHLIFGRNLKSYRDLPVRIAEYGTCHRNELSGTLTGLLRVRSLRMNDAHIYCRKDQIKDEIASVLRMIKKYFETFGLDHYWFRLSKGDVNNKKKYIEQPENWEYAENVLREVLVSENVPFKEASDEAAFYGPKIDVQFKNVFGREETMSTVQLDFAAKERFGLNYIDETGKKNNEVFVIHRAPLSTHERFMAFLIEHYAGKFPVWLSPVQVIILPLSEAFQDYASEFALAFKKEKIRTEVDLRQESISYKVRDAQLKKIPYILVIGQKEMDSEMLSVRTRENIVIQIEKNKFIAQVSEKKNDRTESIELQQ